MFSKLFSILLVTVNLFALAKTQNCSPPQYYDINSNQCQNCLDNCNMCNTNSSCDSCKPGFYLFNKNKYCQQCSVQNCYTCIDNMCTVCNDGYIMFQQRCSYLNNSMVIAYMAGGICGGLTIFMFCLCYWMKKCKQVHREEYYQNQKPHPTQIEQQSQIEIKIAESWKNVEDYEIKKSELCPFCLESNSNIELPCHHLYHNGCISKWLKQHKQCPICKRIVYGNSIIYCCNCYEYNLKLDSKYLTNDKFEQKIICQKCTIIKNEIKIIK